MDSNYSVDYLGFEKMIFSQQLTDTAKEKLYGARMPLPDQYVFLASVFDGEMKLYLDYQTMPDHIERAKRYIDSLAAHKKVYLLSLITTHTIPEIGLYSLQALGKLNDPRCIPFLIELAQYKSALLDSGSVNIDLHEEYLRTLTETLDKLTGCNTQPQGISFGISGTLSGIGLSVPLWKNKIKMFDDHYLMR